MADQVSLDIQIRTLADTHGAEAVAASLGKLTGSQEDLTQYQKDSAIPVQESWSETAKKSGEAAHGSAAGHRAMHMALHKLNEIVPGLGSTMALLSRGMEGEAAAAETGAAANESFITSLGPIAILLLSIEAAMKYWDMYKEKVKEAEEANSEMFKKFAEDSKNAYESFKKLEEAMHPKAEATKKYTEELERQKELLEARIKAEKEVNKVNEEGRMRSQLATWLQTHAPANHPHPKFEQFAGGI